MDERWGDPPDVEMMAEYIDDLEAEIAELRGKVRPAVYIDGERQVSVMARIGKQRYYGMVVPNVWIHLPDDERQA